MISSGSGRLPACVVRIRSVLRFIDRAPFSAACNWRDMRRCAYCIPHRRTVQTAVGSVGAPRGPLSTTSLLSGDRQLAVDTRLVTGATL